MLYSPEFLAYGRVGNCSTDEASQAAAARLKVTLHHHASTGLADDWQLVRSLFFSACSQLPGEITRPVRDELVETLLQHHPPRLEAVELLRKTPTEDGEQSHHELRLYLRYFCTKHTDETLQVAEARKLFKAMQLYCVPLEAEVLRPLVQIAVERGKPEVAHDLLTTLSSEMALSLSLPMMTDIIRGYGRQLNWTRIDELVTWLHDQGISRKRPRGFAAIIRHAFNLFASYNPSTEQTYDFLTYCIQSCGTVPTARLTKDVLRLCVRRRRYDLVHRWMKDRQILFPGLVSMVVDPSAAQEIAYAWAADSTRHVSASDILATCKAVARGATRNPFSEEFRYVAAEAITNDILARCAKLCWAVNTPTLLDMLPTPKNFKSFNDLHAYAEDVLSGALHGERRGWAKSSPKLHTRIALIRSNLIHELSSAHEAHLLLNDFTAYLRIYGSPSFDSDVPEEHGSTEGTSEDKMIRKFSDQWRYQSQTAAEVVHHVKSVYQDLESKGEKLKNSILFTALIGLINIERYRSVLAVLHELHRSKWAGMVFNRHILSLWVQTAMTVSNPSALGEALWAVVDTPSSVELPARFLVLVRLAQADLLCYDGIGWRQMTQAQHDEIEYLKKRIYRRKWYQMGCPAAEDIEEKNLQEWAREQNGEELEATNSEADLSMEEPDMKAAESIVQLPIVPSKDMVFAGDHHIQPGKVLGSVAYTEEVVGKHTVKKNVDQPAEQVASQVVDGTPIAVRAAALTEVHVPEVIMESDQLSTIRDDLQPASVEATVASQVTSQQSPDSPVHNFLAPWDKEILSMDEHIPRQPIIHQQSAFRNDVHPTGDDSTVVEEHVYESPVESTVHQPFAIWEDMPPIGESNPQTSTDAYQPPTSTGSIQEDNPPSPTDQRFDVRHRYEHGRPLPEVFRIRRLSTPGREMRKIKEHKSWRPHYKPNASRRRSAKDSHSK